MAHVDQPTAELFRFLSQARDGGEARMEAARDVHAEIERFFQLADPFLVDVAALVGDPEDQGLRTRGGAFLERNVLESDIRLAALQPELPDAPFRSPPGDAVGGFRGKLIMRIAEVQKVWEIGREHV